MIKFGETAFLSIAACVIILALNGCTHWWGQDNSSSSSEMNTNQHSMHNYKQ